MPLVEITGDWLPGRTTALFERFFHPNTKSEYGR